MSRTELLIIKGTNIWAHGYSVIVPFFKKLFTLLKIIKKPMQVFDFGMLLPTNNI
jgi:hypothetical protein